MNCPRCQKALRDDSRFCTGCGFQIESPRNSSADSITVDPSQAKLAPASDHLIGKQLDNKYELVSRLGEGGMGTVYRARRVHIGDEVAVKVLHTRYVAQKEAIERFRREARAAAQLRHPNVVVIYDYGEAPNLGVPGYIVMELVEGQALGDILETDGQLTPERTIALMRQICAGVGAAHKRNIIHRDLKPDNVVILPADGDDGEETVKVVDFGLAKLRDMLGVDTLTATGTIMGTPYYMSPEQCQGEDLDPRSDVYSLGAMLYEMLAGERPFSGPSAAAIIVKHLTEEPPRLPPQLNLPPSLTAACRRALSKNRDDRQADASAFSRELFLVPSRPEAQEINPTPPAPTAPVVTPPVRKITGENVPIPTLTHVGAAIQHTPQAQVQGKTKGRGGVIGIAVAIVVLALIAGVAGFLVLRKRNAPARTQTKENPTRQRTTANSSEPTGGTMQTGSATAPSSDGSQLRQTILGRWRNKSGTLEIQFREVPTGIEGFVLRVPEAWPRNRVKVGDAIFVKGKFVGDTLEGLYVNLPQNTDCANLETKYSKCVISFEKSDTLRVTNSAFKYSFPECVWSAVTYDDTWNWYRF